VAAALQQQAQTLKYAIASSAASCSVFPKDVSQPEPKIFQEAYEAQSTANEAKGPESPCSYSCLSMQLSLLPSPPSSPVPPPSPLPPKPQPQQFNPTNKVQPQQNYQQQAAQQQGNVFLNPNVVTKSPVPQLQQQQQKQQMPRPLLKKVDYICTTSPDRFKLMMKSYENNSSSIVLSSIRSESINSINNPISAENLYDIRQHRVAYPLPTLVPNTKSYLLALYDCYYNISIPITSIELVHCYYYYTIDPMRLLTALSSNPQQQPFVNFSCMLTIAKNEHEITSATLPYYFVVSYNNNFRETFGPFNLVVESPSASALSPQLPIPYRSLSVTNTSSIPQPQKQIQQHQHQHIKVAQIQASNTVTASIAQTQQLLPQQPQQTQKQQVEAKQPQPNIRIDLAKRFVLQLSSCNLRHSCDSANDLVTLPCIYAEQGFSDKDGISKHIWFAIVASNNTSFMKQQSTIPVLLTQTNHYRYIMELFDSGYCLRVPITRITLVHIDNQQNQQENLCSVDVDEMKFTTNPATGYSYNFLSSSNKAPQLQDDKMDKDKYLSMKKAAEEATYCIGLYKSKLPSSRKHNILYYFVITCEGTRRVVFGPFHLKSKYK